MGLKAQAMQGSYVGWKGNSQYYSCDDENIFSKLSLS